LRPQLLLKARIVFGGKLWARTFHNQWVEAAIKCAVLNQMARLGMPHTLRVLWGEPHGALADHIAEDFGSFTCFADSFPRTARIIVQGPRFEPMFIVAVHRNGAP
jgi:hypothetical protein